MTTGTDLPRPAVLARRLLTLLALATLALHGAALQQYGYFRDELYYLASTEHLDWGYVDHPPLSIAVLWLVRQALGSSLIALRLLPALAGAAVVVLTGVIAARLGGGRYAQGLAALAALVAPSFLSNTHVYSMNAFDLLLWTLAVLVLLRVLRTGAARDWILLGAVVGLGLLNKISVLWFGAGLFVGLVLTPHRRALRHPGPYLAALTAALLFLPHLLWQAAHGWPTLEFMRNATEHKMARVSALDFLARQVLEMGPGNFLIWTAGLLFALFARGGRPARVLAWIFVAVMLLLASSGRSRASYLSVAYPMLLALGGIAFERALSAAPWRRLRAAAVAIAALGGLVMLPFALPVLPVQAFIRYQAALGMRPSTEENLRVGPLPQHYADMFGWEELVAGVADAYRRLDLEERASCRVFGQNYGEAGAIDVIGRRLGLPRAMSAHNSYWLWGPGDFDGSVLIIIGGDSGDNASFFEEVEIVGRVDAPLAMPYERGLPISIARRAKSPIAEAWPRLKVFI